MRNLAPLPPPSKTRSDRRKHHTLPSGVYRHVPRHYSPIQGKCFSGQREVGICKMGNGAIWKRLREDLSNQGHWPAADPLPFVFPRSLDESLALSTSWGYIQPWPLKEVHRAAGYRCFGGGGRNAFPKASWADSVHRQDRRLPWLCPSCLCLFFWICLLGFPVDPEALPICPINSFPG